MLRFSVQDGRDVDALKSALAPSFEDYLLELGPGSKDFSAQIGLCRLKQIQIYYGRYKHAFRVQSPNAICFMQSFPIQGSGRHIVNGIEMTSTSRKGILAAPGQINLSYDANFEHVAVFVDPDALSKTLAALVGVPQSGQLRLDLSNYEARPEARIVRHLVELLLAELDSEESIPSPFVTAELEQAVLVAFLCGNKHNYNRLLDGPPLGTAPWQLRRVEEYIEANWDQPIAIEALAIVANASARSIFHSFKERRGCSPMNFVKQVRLKHGREMLSQPASGTTVTSVAFACGFGNLGHFAADYRQAFGETPSATLNCARGQSPS